MISERWLGRACELEATNRSVLVGGTASAEPPRVNIGAGLAGFSYGRCHALGDLWQLVTLPEVVLCQEP
jgi:hypothetical protein